MKESANIAGTVPNMIFVQNCPSHLVLCALLVVVTLKKMFDLSTLLFSPAARVGRQLAKIGDDINLRYQPEFDQMINQLDMSQSTAYDVFAGVAKK